GRMGSPSILWVRGLFSAGRVIVRGLSECLGSRVMSLSDIRSSNAVTVHSTAESEALATVFL
ncbi:hypothetical protein DN540_37165, partial [Burkholderia multivorans]